MIHAKTTKPSSSPKATNNFNGHPNDEAVRFLGAFICTVKARQYLRDGRAPLPKNEQVSATMSRIRAKNTKPERLMRSALSAAEVRGYRLHYTRVPGRPDITFVGRKVAVFVH